MRGLAVLLSGLALVADLAGLYSVVDYLSGLLVFLSGDALVTVPNALVYGLDVLGLAYLVLLATDLDFLVFFLPFFLGLVHLASWAISTLENGSTGLIPSKNSFFSSLESALRSSLLMIAARSLLFGI